MSDFLDDIFLLVLGGFSIWFAVMSWVIIASMHRKKRGTGSTDTEAGVNKEIKTDD